MKFSFAEPDFGKKGAIAVGVAEGRKLGAAASRLDQRSGGAIARALAGSKFTGKLGDLLDIPGPAGVAQSRIVLYGLGKPADLIEGKAEDLGGGLFALLASTPESAAAVVVDAGAGLAAPRAAAHMAYGARLRAYRFDKYRTKLKPEERPKLAGIVFMVEDSPSAKREFSPARQGRGRGVLRARSGCRAAQRDLSRIDGAAGQDAVQARLDRRGARDARDAQARHGRAARRRPGLDPRAAGRGDALERRRQGQAADRLHRQGRHVRQRWPVAQNLQGHGGHEMGHGGIGRRGRHHGGAGRAARQDPTRSA